MDKDTILKIMSSECDGSDKSQSSGIIGLLSRYSDVTIRMYYENGEYVYRYVSSVKDLASSDITEEELEDVRNNGWNISDDKKYIFKET